MSNSDKEVVSDVEKNKIDKSPGPSLDKVHSKNLDEVRTFMMDGFVGTSPPNFVSLEEIKKATNGLQNMALAHEIAVDPNFRIEKLESEKDPLQAQVKEMLHKAFWDILSNELNSVPPVYNQALQLLKEIKESLFEILQPEFIATKNGALKERIAEVLDTDLIQQQLDKGDLIFSHYAQFVISIMAKICAPVRDEEIKELSNCTDIVETFKGIMEILQLMKLDLANFTIRMIRPNIVASSIEYEKAKFAEFLKIQVDGLVYTKKWLLTHLSEEKIQELIKDPSSLKNITSQVLNEAFIELLEFDFSPTAETLMMDQKRLLELRDKREKYSIAACILLLLKPMLDRSKVESPDDVETLKRQILPILDSMSSNSDIKKIAPNILVQIKAYINKIQNTSPKVTDFPGFTDLMSLLDKNILELYNPELPIRKLVSNRVRQFLRDIIVTQSPNVTMPPGIPPVQKEITLIGGQCLVIINHNKNVYGEYYQDIISNAVSKNL